MVVMEPLSRNWSYPDCTDLNEIFVQYINGCSVAYLESSSTPVCLSRVGYDGFSLRYNWCKHGVISGSKHFYVVATFTWRDQDQKRRAPKHAWFWFYGINVPSKSIAHNGRCHENGKQALMAMGPGNKNEVDDRSSSRLMMWSNWYVFRLERRRSKLTSWWRICRSTCRVSVCQNIFFYAYSVLTIFIASWQVIVNNLTYDMALSACHLSDSFPLSTVYSRVKAARRRGTYDAVLKLRQEQEIQRLVIDIEDDESSDGDDSGSAKRAPTISPVTMVDCTNTTTTEETSTSSGDKRSSGSSTNKSQVFRKSSKQSTAECLNNITVKTEYDERYKLMYVYLKSNECIFFMNG